VPQSEHDPSNLTIQSLIDVEPRADRTLLDLDGSTESKPIAARPLCARPAAELRHPCSNVDCSVHPAITNA
jgi:hypothetical protein